MPTFDYQCKICSHTTEMKTKGEQEMFQHCPECGQPTYWDKKLSAPIGFILKGQGFYRSSRG